VVSTAVFLTKANSESVRSTSSASIREGFLAGSGVTSLNKAGLVSPVQAIATLLPIAVISVCIVVNLATKATELAFLVTKTAGIAKVETLAIDLSDKSRR